MGKFSPRIDSNPRTIPLLPQNCTRSHTYSPLAKSSTSETASPQAQFTNQVNITAPLLGVLDDE